jgi:hypothetical protein
MRLISSRSMLHDRERTRVRNIAFADWAEALEAEGLSE